MDSDKIYSGEIIMAYEVTEGEHTIRYSIPAKEIWSARVNGATMSGVFNKFAQAIKETLE